MGGVLRVFADLHLHTRYSDGRDSPSAVVAAVAGAGLCAMAITDHDCVAGIDEALREGERLGVEVIPAVEITSYVGPVEVHVLGYFIDHRNAGLLRALWDFQEERVSRLFKMLEKLDGMGIRIEASTVTALSGEGSVGRPHLAKVLVDEGYASDIRAAFRKYVGDRAPAYVPRERIQPGEAVRIIKDGGGIPVIAHPGGMKDDAIIPSLVADGMEGIEVHYSTHSPSQVKRYLDIADRYGLLITGGSDYHGSMKGETVSVGDFGIDGKLYEKLLEYRQYMEMPGRDKTHTPKS